MVRNVGASFSQAKHLLTSNVQFVRPNTSHYIRLLDFSMELMCYCYPRTFAFRGGDCDSSNSSRIRLVI